MKHGTVYSYRRGCRCVDCTAAKTADMRAYYSRKRKGRGPNAGIVLVARNCGHCGVSMKRSHDGRPGECADCKWKRGSKLRIGRAERLAIYERDRWMCGICTEPVDPHLPSNDIWGATLAHLVPRSLGGGDDPANLRLAHRWCNSVRGNLSHYTDADLSA